MLLRVVESLHFYDDVSGGAEALSTTLSRAMAFLVDLRWACRATFGTSLISTQQPPLSPTADYHQSTVFLVRR